MDCLLRLALSIAALCYSARAQLGYPGVQSLTSSSPDATGAFQTAFYLYDSQPVCSPSKQAYPDGECICLCHRYPNTTAPGCVSDVYTLDYPFYSRQPSCQPADKATGECNCNCRYDAAATTCRPQVTLPEGPTAAPAAPTPTGAC